MRKSPHGHAVFSLSVALLCGPGEHKCFKENKCISLEQCYDGAEDCRFGEDENDLDPGQGPRVRCVKKLPIPESKR